MITLIGSILIIGLAYFVSVLLSNAYFGFMPCKGGLTRFNKRERIIQGFLAIPFIIWIAIILNSIIANLAR